MINRPAENPQTPEPEGTPVTDALHALRSGVSSAGSGVLGPSPLDDERSTDTAARRQALEIAKGTGDRLAIMTALTALGAEAPIQDVSALYVQLITPNTLAFFSQGPGHWPDGFSAAQAGDTERILRGIVDLSRSTKVVIPAELLTPLVALVDRRASSTAHSDRTHNLDLAADLAVLAERRDIVPMLNAWKTEQGLAPVVIAEPRSAFGVVADAASRSVTAVTDGVQSLDEQPSHEHPRVRGFHPRTGK